MSLKLRDYQRAGVDFLLSNPFSAALAPVGAGKTAVAISAMQAAKATFLILAPRRVAMEVWPVELAKWAPEIRYFVLPAKRTKPKSIPPCRVLIANYEIIEWLIANIPPPQGVIFDELTRLKHATGIRARKTYLYTRAMKIRWGLTGSFTSNGLEDIFGQCRSLSPNILGAYKTKFLAEYFTRNPFVHGPWIPRPGAFDRVMERVKPYTFVLENSSYYASLPALNIVDIDVSMNLVAYNALKTDLITELEGATITATSAETVLNKLQQLASGFHYESEGTRWVSTHKFEALESLWAELQHQNIIVFYWFQAERDRLKDWFPKAETIDAPNVVERWNVGKVPMLLLQPMSAGHGLNLQFGGCKAVFFTLPWSYELYEQAIGRLHRGGQINPVWVYRLLTKETVDHIKAKTLVKKASFSETVKESLK